MSLSTSSECSVALPAVVRRSKEETGLNGEGCGQHKPTAALGQHSHSAAVGQTNCAESQTHSAGWWTSLIFEACVRDNTFGREMVRAGGNSFHNSEYQKIVDFTVRDYFLSFHPTLPCAICFICFPLCLLLSFHKAHTNVLFACQPIRAESLDMPLIVVFRPTLPLVANKNEVSMVNLHGA